MANRGLSSENRISCQVGIGIGASRLHAQALVSGERVVLHLGDVSLDREEATAQQVKGLVELLQFSDMFYMQKIVK